MISVKLETCTPPHTAHFIAPIKLGVFAQLRPLRPRLLPLGVVALRVGVVGHRVDHRPGVIAVKFVVGFLLLVLFLL